MLKNTLRWFGYIERMNCEEFVKKMYVSEIKGPSRGGRPLGRWKDKVKEYSRLGEVLSQCTQCFIHWPRL